MAENPYDVLGIAASATPAEVKRAYRRKVLQCHPDAVGDGREGEFHRVQQAYEALDTPHRTGRDTSATGWRPPPRHWGPASRSVLQLELELDRVEARDGLVLSIPLDLEMPCPHCAGLGFLSLLCARCGGWGRLRTQVSVRTDVPPGVHDGDVIYGRGALDEANTVVVEFLVRVAGT